MNDLVSNPFAGQMTEQSNALELAEQQRQEAEIQSALVIANRFPRSPLAATDRILQACARPKLAEAALYAYPRGTELVTGETIRLAEALAMGWGNLQFGARELSNSNGVSVVEAFAWDLETNVRTVLVFQVPHIRYSKHGTKRLEDPRDIYEMVANHAARRVRACILKVIPKDVVEAARAQCERTMEQSAEVGEEQIGKLLDAFSQYGVTKQQVEDRLGHRVDSVIAAEVVGLRKIYASISQGFAKPEDFFGRTADEKGETLKDRMQNKTRTEKPKPEWPKQRDGKWYDSRGVEFHPDYHGMRNDKPSVTAQGHFRRRRGCDDASFARYEREQLAPKPDNSETESKSDEVDAAAKAKANSQDEMFSQTNFEFIENAIRRAKDQDDLLAAEDLLRSFHGTAEEVKALQDHIATANQAMQES